MNRQERPRRDPKFELSYKPEDIERFDPDSIGGPVVGFVYEEDRTVRLVTFEHDLVVTSKEGGTLKVDRQREPACLLYTPGEWAAFCLGVKADEAQMHDGQTVSLRDSKDPNGPILFFTFRIWRPFIDAIKDGKYSIPSVEKKLMRRKQSPLRRLLRRT